MTLDHQKVWNTMNELEMVTSKICSAREILDSAIDRLQEHQYDKSETLMYAVDEFLQYYLEEFDRKFKEAWQETVVALKKEETDAWDAVIQEREYYEPSMPPWGHSDMEYVSQNKFKCDKDDPSPECKGAWNNFWEENYCPESRYTDEEMDAMCDKAALDEKHSESYYDYTRNDYNRQNPFDKVVKWRLPIEEVKDSDADETEYFITFPDDLLEAANINPGDEVEWVDQNNGSFILRKVTKPLGTDGC